MICVIEFDNVERMCASMSRRLENDVFQRWLFSAAKTHILKTGDFLVPVLPFDLTEEQKSDPFIVRALEQGAELKAPRNFWRLDVYLRLVCDWLAGLPEREPGRARRITRMTFADAVAASERWHRQLAKKAEKFRCRAIPDDQENAPTVLDTPSMGSGWHWVWLKTPKARRLEGEAMGHCIGSGGYENILKSEGIFSLRDPDGIPHVTMHLDMSGLKQVVGKSNSRVSERFIKPTQHAIRVLRLRLHSYRDPTHMLSDGNHTIALTTALGHEYTLKLCVKNEMLHNLSEPAMVIGDEQFHWYYEGVLHREGGPAVIWKDGKTFWYENGEEIPPPCSIGCEA